jgi:hypothetical protein
MRKPTKKLGLSMETVRLLTPSALGEVAGGQKPVKPKSISICYCESDICPTNLCF